MTVGRESLAIDQMTAIRLVGPRLKQPVVEIAVARFVARRSSPVVPLAQGLLQLSLMPPFGFGSVWQGNGGNRQYEYAKYCRTGMCLGAREIHGAEAEIAAADLAAAEQARAEVGDV